MDTTERELSREAKPTLDAAPPRYEPPTAIRSRAATKDRKSVV